MIRAQGLELAMNMLRAAPNLAQVAVNSAMVSGEYTGDMRTLAEQAIRASVPASHEHLVSPLVRLVEHESTSGVMKFWANAGGMATIGSLPTQAELEMAVLGITMDEVKAWVRNFKDIEEVDLLAGERIDYDHIASRVWNAKTINPSLFTEMKSGERSLLANSKMAPPIAGLLGLPTSDGAVIGDALAAVLVAWTGYILREVPQRISDNLRTQLA